MLKVSLLFNKFTNFMKNNSRILKIKNVKFSGYCFYMDTCIERDFKICISVPLNEDRLFTSSFHNNQFGKLKTKIKNSKSKKLKYRKSRTIFVLNYNDVNTWNKKNYLI